MNLNKYTINNTTLIDGKESIYDTIRKKFVLLTPEEIVRQKVVLYLMNDLNVPLSALDEEISLKYYKFDSKKRPDILVLGKNIDTGDVSPVVVIECKAPNICLSDEVIEQALFYADSLQSEYMLITNGTKHIICKYNYETNRYDDIDELPKYENMFV